MKESENPNKLYFNNDTIALSFNFYLEGLMIGFTNRSGEQIKIKWDEIKMTVDGNEKKIQHTLFREENFFAFQPPLIFPPKSGCTDLLVLADNVYYLTESGSEIMKIKDMYPERGDKSSRDTIRQLIGQRITLHFPIEIKNVAHSWLFNFSLEDIKFIRETNTGFTYSYKLPRQQNLD